MSAQELITDHLDLWTSAVTHKSGSGHSASGKNGKIELTGIKKLRELILELAVRGKLAEQDPSDEPASELLDRIAEEKTRLVKEGKIKKSKGLKPIDEKDKPFFLPEGWSWVRLGETMEMYNGKAFKSSEWSTSGLPIVRIQNLNDPHAPTNYFNGEINENHRIDNGAFLISWSGTPGTSFGAFIWERGPAALNQHINKCVFFGDHLEPLFMKLAVNGQMSHFVQSAQGGVGLKHVTKSVLNNALIALPPFAEQCKIVEKVDELMALCDRLEQQVGDQLKAHEVLVDTLLDALTRSADAAEVAESWARVAEHFDTLFTTEASIDKLKLVVLDLAASGKLIDFHVEKRPLKNILSFGPRNGLSPKESSFHTGIKVLKLGATTKGTLKLSESKDIDIDEPESSHLWLKKGDILIQRGNAARHVGCNIMIESNQPGFIYPDLMMKIRTKKEANPKFISYCLSSPQSRIFMWDRMTGTSGTMPKISKKTVGSIPVPLPDIKTQTATVEKVDELMALCDRLKVRLGETAETRAQLAEAVVNQTVS
ncbi:MULTISPECIES: restriction endonuclease subunit S [unclassified Halomonas]|uniref:restriction endonuclease subunit S n=1 Tax=unclassified Halomonas TaxID=2609666 RepID=UPI001C98722A|nr:MULTISPECIES: restriction endonuclease subunit S [unclassified Halomonas]MBY5924045.1 restriction endonuclease subunit S [Halomonas sp. DP4Y7-2]MBY6231087.1 restriction endonuclease subunit S [Halomonas sp. DP4Y7-1]